MDDKNHEYILQAEGIPGLVLDYDTDTINVDAGKVIDLPVRIRVDEDSLESRSNDIGFILTAEDNPKLTITESARFLGP